MDDEIGSSWTKQSHEFARDLSLFVLDEIGVVFSESAQEIYELNTTATYIWSRLEEGVNAPQLHRDLAETFSFDLSQAKQHIDEILTQWHALGFFDQTEPFRPTEIRTPWTSRNSAAEETFKERPFVSEHCYEILGQRSRVGLSTNELETWVYPAFAHLEVPCRDSEPGEIKFSVVSDDNGFIVGENGKERCRCPTVREVAPLLNARIFRRSIERAGYAVAFHAGGVSDGRRALLLPGQAGSGKTSLTAALLHAGYEYLSDDLVLMRNGNVELEGVPFSLCVKNDAPSPLTDLYSELQDCIVHTRRDGKNVRYLPPPPQAFQINMGRSARASWVVFPKYQANGMTCLKEIPRSDALRRLTKGCTLSRPVSREQVGNLVRLLRSVTTYELPMVSLEIATRLLQDLWKQA